MDKLVVHGGSTLRGAINISGSKNASLPILAAAILTGEDCIIRRVPDVSDTNYMIQILSALGADVERSSGTVRISCADVIDEAPYELVRRMRASVCVMGPLLARKGLHNLDCHKYVDRLENYILNLLNVRRYLTNHYTY